jgi:signal transduction histidine kinase
MPVPVESRVAVGRLHPTVEATAYFFVAEAPTNVAKHARARHAEVTACIDDGTLAIQVRDDGMGAARPDGSGLLGARTVSPPSTAGFRSRAPPTAAR